MAEDGSSSSSSSSSSAAVGSAASVAAIRRKALYRRALAREASKRFDAAQEDVAAARADPFINANERAQERAQLERDAARLAKLVRHRDAAAAASEARKAEEKAVGATRAAGVRLRNDNGEGGKKSKSRSEAAAAPNDGIKAGSTTMGYLDESDLSAWATARLAARLGAVSVDLGFGASVRVDAFNDRKSTVHASVTRKRGQRALYYDLDVHATWVAEPPNETFDLSPDSTPPKVKDDEPRALRGVVRLYNVSQETRYEPGADPTVAYMYQLGYEALPPGWFDGETAGDAAPHWAAQLIDGAHELYEAFANEVDALIRDLKAK